MFRKLLLSSALGAFLAMGAANAEVVVRVSPPAPLADRRPPMPAPGYVWTPGYQHWDGRGYVWTPGLWRLPPHPHAHWAAYHWVHRDGGWVLVEGHWR